jgi:hypothetical protein
MGITMTTAVMQTSSGRPARVFWANFLGGPLVIAALITGSIAAFTAIMILMHRNGSAGGAAFILSMGPMMAVVWVLSSLLPGFAAALYAVIEVNRRGTYLVPVAIAIAMAVAFAWNVARTHDAMLAPLVMAGAGAAVAGWLARRSGATWR